MELVNLWFLVKGAVAVPFKSLRYKALSDTSAVMGGLDAFHQVHDSDHKIGNKQIALQQWNMILQGSAPDYKPAYANLKQH